MKFFVNKSEIRKEIIMRKKKTSGIRKNLLKVIITAIMINVMSVNVFAASVMATGADSILQPVKLLQTLFFGIIALVGLFLIGKGILELSTAIPQRDSTSIKEATLTIIGGVLAAGISAVLGFIGIAV